jgi:hypothetical protein
LNFAGSIPSLCPRSPFRVRAANHGPRIATLSG